jgi:hypothetical protein
MVRLGGEKRAFTLGKSAKSPLISGAHSKLREVLKTGFHQADCVLDCHQDALLHFQSWPGTSLTRAPRGSGSGTGLSLRAWRVFRFRRTGRIPNFAGAEVAAARLFNIEPWKSATTIKLNPDSPQRPLRAEALRRGITVFIATPRLPRRVPIGQSPRFQTIFDDFVASISNRLLLSSRYIVQLRHGISKSRGAFFCSIGGVVPCC